MDTGLPRAKQGLAAERLERARGGLPGTSPIKPAERAPYHTRLVRPHTGGVAGALPARAMLQCTNNSLATSVRVWFSTVPKHKASDGGAEQDKNAQRTMCT
jgi:hypothetical protein